MLPVHNLSFVQGVTVSLWIYCISSKEKYVTDDDTKTHKEKRKSAGSAFSLFLILFLFLINKMQPVSVGSRCNMQEILLGCRARQE